MSKKSRTPVKMPSFDWKGFLKAIVSAIRYALQIVICLFVAIFMVEIFANIAVSLATELAKNHVIGGQDAFFMMGALVGGGTAGMVFLAKYVWSGLSAIVKKLMDWKVTKEDKDGDKDGKEAA